MNKAAIKRIDAIVKESQLLGVDPTDEIKNTLSAFGADLKLTKKKKPVVESIQEPIKKEPELKKLEPTETQKAETALLEEVETNIKKHEDKLKKIENEYKATNHSDIAEKQLKKHEYLSAIRDLNKEISYLQNKIDSSASKYFDSLSQSLKSRKEKLEKVEKKIKENNILAESTKEILNSKTKEIDKDEFINFFVVNNGTEAILNGGKQKELFIDSLIFNLIESLSKLKVDLSGKVQQMESDFISYFSSPGILGNKSKIADFIEDYLHVNFIKNLVESTQPIEEPQIAEQESAIESDETEEPSLKYITLEEANNIFNLFFETGSKDKIYTKYAPLFKGKTKEERKSVKSEIDRVISIAEEKIAEV